MHRWLYTQMEYIHGDLQRCRHKHRREDIHTYRCINIQTDTQTYTHKDTYTDRHIRHKHADRHIAIDVYIRTTMTVTHIMDADTDMYGYTYRHVTDTDALKPASDLQADG